MEIIVTSRRGYKSEGAEQRFSKKFKLDNLIIIDVTSRGPEEWQVFSPFFAVKDKKGKGFYDVPYLSGIKSFSVEGIWQGLKMFELEKIDYKKFENKTGKNIKRTVRKNGKV